jgi:hypothetical protein
MNNPRRNRFGMPIGEWTVPSLPHDADPETSLDRVLRGQGMQRGFDTVSNWRMGSLGLGSGEGANFQPSTSEEPLDY